MLKQSKRSSKTLWAKLYKGTKEPVVDRIRRYVESQKKPLERPKAKYDNPNWQDRINELLNTDLPSGRYPD